MPAARAPPTSASTLSPTCKASSGRTPVALNANSKIFGSGLATPTAVESTTMSTSTPSPGPTWQMRRRLRFSAAVPSALETIARRTPAARTRGRASRESSITATFVARVEGVPAGARADGVRVVHGEAGAHQAVHVVDLRPTQVLDAELVQDDLDALLLDDFVVGADLVVEGHAVLKA